MDRPFKHTVVTNASREQHGLISATTKSGNAELPVQWMRWTIRADRIRITGEDVVTLLDAKRQHGTTEFQVELHDEGYLSRIYDVTGLIAAVNENAMDTSNDDEHEVSRDY